MVYLWKSKNFINSNELVTFCDDCNIAPQHCHIIYNSNQKVYILFYIEQSPICFSCNNKQTTECVDENLVPFGKVCEYLDEYLWNTNDDNGDPIVESVCNITKEKFIKELKWFIEYNHGTN